MADCLIALVSASSVQRYLCIRYGSSDIPPPIIYVGSDQAQSETAPKWIRGAIVGCYQWAITIGLFIAAIVNNSTKNRDDTGSYRIPIAVQFAWAIILVGGMLVLPETPR
jgi:hypothetical protein